MNILSKIRNYVSSLNLPKAAAILFLLGFSAYANVFSYPFIHDDIVFIQNNPHIADLKNWPQVFLNPDWPPPDEPLVNPYYRPFLEIFYRLEYFLFGLAAPAYHAVNVVGHILNSILLFVFLRNLLSSASWALTVCILFLLHPIQTETVVCVSGISNLLVCFFLLVSLNLYVRSRNYGSRLSLAGALLSFVLALLTKEQAIVLPALLLLHDFCFRRAGPADVQRKIFPSAAFWTLALLYLGWRQAVLGEAVTALAFNPTEFWLRITAIPKILLMYLGLLIFPMNLHYYRSVNILDPVGASPLYLLLVILMLMKIFQRRTVNDQRLMTFALGWFLLTLLPMLNIIPLVIEYAFLFTAEHFLYLPGVGFLLFVTMMGRHVLQRFAKKYAFRAAGSIAAVVAVIFYALTLKQSISWRGEVPLFERTLQFENRVGRVHWQLAKAYYLNGELEKAIAEYRRALEIFEDYLEKTRFSPARTFYEKFMIETHFDLGYCFEGLGQFPQAIQHYERAAAMNPKESVFLNNLGMVYLKMENLLKAQGYFGQAVEMNPDDVRALNNLALWHIQKKDFSTAERLLRRAMEVDPGFLPARQNLERLVSEEKVPDKK